MDIIDQSAARLEADQFSAEGKPLTDSDEVTLVKRFVEEADAYVNKEQWKTAWRESDILYQSPRPFSTFENSYVLEPNVQRFTVAKDVNSIAPQFYKGLFYEDPPFLLRPAPGTSQEVISAKKAVNSYLLRTMNFQREVKLGLEQQVHMGTGIWEWGMKYEDVTIEKRVSQTKRIPAGQGQQESVYSDEEPKIEKYTVRRCCPTFEFVDLANIFVSPKLAVPDIREAPEVARQQFLNYYEFRALRDADRSFNIPADEVLKSWWQAPAESNVQLSQMQQMTAQNTVVHHAEQPNVEGIGNPLMRKLEMLTYWNDKQCISVVDRKLCIRSMDNSYGCVPFLSANYWNRRKAFWGIGVGMIAGGDQRVQQGTVNSALKILAMKVNVPYLRNADANMPSQTVLTGLGKILTVADITKAYKLMETPDVPAELWQALQESKSSSESATGADQMLVGGSTAGPRTSMGRTAGGASILAGASATRLDGPLDNFIDQVFVPYLYILDMLVKRYMSDKQIIEICGEKLGKAFVLDLQDFHDAKAEYDVLAGARLAARAAMAQSLVLIFQLLENPQVQENLADINQEIVDLKPLLKVAFEVSQWGSGIENDIFRPMSPDQKQARAQKNSQAAKLQQQMLLNNQKFSQKQALNDQETDNRIKSEITRDAFRAAGLNEAVTGNPNPGGLGGSEYSIE